MGEYDKQIKVLKDNQRKKSTNNLFPRQRCIEVWALVNFVSVFFWVMLLLMWFGL